MCHGVCVCVCHGVCVSTDDKVATPRQLVQASPASPARRQCMHSCTRWGCTDRKCSAMTRREETLGAWPDLSGEDEGHWCAMDMTSGDVPRGADIRHYK